MPLFDIILPRLFGFGDPFYLPKGKLPPIQFVRVIEDHKPPNHSEMAEDELHIVAKDRRRKWLLFRCPCGCKDVVTLSLQAVHRPHWNLREKHGRSYLFPSVWRDVGCFSHFWIKDGRVFWISDSGTSPEQRRW